MLIRSCAMGHGILTIRSVYAGLATYILLWPEDGVMKKEDVRCVYDGSIFVDIASKRARGVKQKAR